MTTKAIREFIEHYARSPEDNSIAGDRKRRALAEVEAIEEAAKALSDSGDVDHVDAAISQEAMCRYDAALGLMVSIAKDAP